MLVIRHTKGVEHWGLCCKYLIGLTSDIEDDGQLVFEAFLHSLLQCWDLLSPEPLPGDTGATTVARCCRYIGKVTAISGSLHRPCMFSQSLIWCPEPTREQHADLRQRHERVEHVSRNQFEGLPILECLYS